MTEEIEEKIEHHVAFTLPVSLEAAEAVIIKATLNYFKGDKRKASDTLGISLKTIYNKLEKYRVQEANHHRVPRS